MAAKPPSQRAASRPVDPDAAAKLADELADKPFGQTRPAKKADRPEFTTTSVSLPTTMIEKLQDTATRNKRARSGHGTVSALVREALEKAGY